MPQSSGDLYPSSSGDSVTGYADVDRRDTPSVVIVDESVKRLATLHKGATYALPDAYRHPIEPAESIEAILGIRAALVVELNLGPDYQLFIFDRGPGSQGSETPLTPESTFGISDRYFVADMAFLMHAHIRHGAKRELLHTQGMVQFCEGSTVIFGRSPRYDHYGQFDPSTMPETVSEKHAAIAVGADHTMHISDLSSTNLTTVGHRIPPKE